MVVSKKNLVVFGGYHDNGVDYKYFNDVHMFNLENRTWKKIEPAGNSPNLFVIWIVSTIIAFETGTGPSARSGCQMVALADGRILVTGGYSKNKVKKDVDKGIIHTDAFVLVPDSTYALLKPFNSN